MFNQSTHPGAVCVCACCGDSVGCVVLILLGCCGDPVRCVVVILLGVLW